jgi:hypothetical protein
MTISAIVDDRSRALKYAHELAWYWLDILNDRYENDANDEAGKAHLRHAGVNYAGSDRFRPLTSMFAFLDRKSDRRDVERAAAGFVRNSTPSFN